jgi:uncharacterized protein (TIGR00290 family)
MDKPSILKTHISPKTTMSRNLYLVTVKGKTCMKVVVSWSGGKDSCYATYKAIQEGFEISSLLIMMSDRGKSNFHMISQELIDTQSEALCLPVVMRSTKPETYEQEFKNALRQAKTNGIAGIVTGDICDVAQHEAGWLERVCREVGMEPIRPLWHRDTRQILNEFISLGFKATVVRVNTSVLGMEWLGRQLNSEFCNDILKVGSVDLCGEHGEYHTFITDGPLFKKRIEILETKKNMSNSWGHLEITRFQIKTKDQ